MKSFFSRSRELISFTLPVAGSMFFNIFSSVVPMFFVAQLGKSELAAAALASSCFVTLLTLGRGFFNAIGIMIGHERGKQESGERYIGEIFRNGMVLALVIGILILFLMWSMAKLLLWFGQSPVLVSLSRGYLYYAGWALLFVILNQTIQQFYMAMGYPRVSFWMAACGAPVTIIMSYLLVFGFLGFPKMQLAGVMGAVLITQISTFITGISMIIFSKFKQTHQLLGSQGWVNRVIIKKMFSLGLPISIQSGAEMIAITLTTFFMGWYGADALAATNVVNQYVVLFVAFYVGCSQAVAILSSHALAAKNYALIRQYATTGIGLMSILFIAVSVIFLLFPHVLISLFMNRAHAHLHAEIYHLGSVFFLIAVLMNYADSVRYIITGSYRGLHDSKRPMLIGVVGLCVVSVGGSYLLGPVLGEGAVGVRIGLALGIISAAVYMLYDLFYGHLSQKLKQPSQVIESAVRMK